MISKELKDRERDKNLNYTRSLFRTLMLTLSLCLRRISFLGGLLSALLHLRNFALKPFGTKMISEESLDVSVNRATASYAKTASRANRKWKRRMRK